jgi:uncharacterized Zn-binding protein involved in type VI secretion
MPDEKKPPGSPDPGAPPPADPAAKEPLKPTFEGEKEGEFGGEGKAERGVSVEGPKKEVVRGNRDPKPKAGDKPDKPDKPEGPVKHTKEVGLGPIYKKKVFENEKSSTKKGDDDKTYYEFLSGKVEVELGSATYDLEKKKATLTIVKGTAKGQLAHGQFDLGGWLHDLIFGETPQLQAAPTAPLEPMAARMGDITVHGSVLAPGPGSPNVFIGGQPAWRVGPDLHLCPFPGGAPHGTGPTALGELSVLINGAPAARAGDYIVEPTGGPDVILMGCPTVFIGAPAPPAPPPPPKGDPKPEDLPWVKFESVTSADLLQVGVEGNVGGEVDIAGKKGNVEARAGAFAAVLKGELPLKLRVRIPFTTYYVGAGVTVEGSLISAGAEAGAGAKVNDGKTLFSADAGAKAGVGLGGVGVKFGVDISGA